jgi:hypothetical protein
LATILRREKISGVQLTPARKIPVKRETKVSITEDLMDARSLFLTANTTTVYVLSCIDLKDGPMVVQVPRKVLGAADDAFFRWVTDVGLTGPDQGRGGKYLFIPPGYQGRLPSDGYFVAKPRSNKVLIFSRAFVEGGNIAVFAAIGIKKGQPFAPDARMKGILSDAVAVANGIARANLFASRDEQTKLYPDRQWVTPFVGDSYQFLQGAERLLDPKAMFFYYATGITPAMTEAKPGTGSAYAVAFRDANGNYFDGAKAYKVSLPNPIPAKNFWAFTVYDNQTRSLLETDQKLAGVDSALPNIKKNSDGSVTVWFGPKASPGEENNWIQTMPGKGWNVALRLYGPLEPWFNKSWKPGDIVAVE